MLQQFRQDDHAAYALAEATKVLSTEHGFLYYLAWATIIQGWALVKQGHGRAGTAQMRQGLTALQGTGAKRSWAYYCAILAEAYGNGGELTEGLRMLADACDHVQRTGECWWEAEIHRQKGELLLKATDRGQQAEETPETCFQQALEVARRQQAKTLELRAAMSLSRLWQQQGKPAAARQLLAEVYGWFSEGLDTVDLQDAKALLEQLA
jgi:predicted ATPase